MASQHTLFITLLSDWRIGSGTGRPGDVDQLVRRDAEHCPFLPAKTIIGVLRDGCEQVAYALDNGQTDGPWAKWSAYLFGNHPGPDKLLMPVNAHLKVDSGHLDDKLRRAIATRPALQSALTLVKPGVKISSASGAAEEKCFRLEEMARGGITLKAPFTIQDSHVEKQDSISEDGKADYALLLAGAALVERIGSKRRRGAGRCRVNLSKAAMDLETAYEYLSKTKKPPEAPLLQSDSHQSLSVVDVSSANDWHRLTLTLMTEQPVIIAQKTVGNVVESLDYIPGSHLLPIVTRHLRRFGVDVGNAIAHSQLIITHALPTANQQATAPMPFALFAEKQSDSSNKDTAFNRLQRNAEGLKQLKQLRKGYVTAENSNNITQTTVDPGIETHNTVNDQQQRPISAEGGVYSYQAIPPGIEFKAELRLQTAVLDQLNQAKQTKDNRSWYQPLADKRVTIGVSRKDEYGRTRLQVSKPEQIKLEQETKSTVEISSSDMTLWLLSDLLLRDEWLRPTTAISDVCRALEKALNLTKGSVSLAEQSQQQFRPGTNDTYTLVARQRRTESWQTRWGLPRPSLAGLQAGSCFRLTVSGSPPTAAALRQLEITGLGERRVEGYGQLRINASLLTKAKITLSKAKDKPEDNNDKIPKLKVPAMPKLVFDYARRVELVAWRDAIQRAALALSMSEEIREQTLEFRLISNGSKPSLSQLGGLRSQLSQLKTEQNKTNILKWIEALLKKDTAFKSTLKKVEDILTEKQDIWQILDLPTTLQITYDDLCCTDNGENDIKKELWYEAVEIFICECVRAHTNVAQKQLDNAKLQEMR